MIPLLPMPLLKTISNLGATPKSLSCFVYPTALANVQADVTAMPLDDVAVDISVFQDMQCASSELGISHLMPPGPHHSAGFLIAVFVFFMIRVFARVR